MKVTHRSSVVFLSLVILAVPACASQILYGTGVDSNNNNLPGESNDPHYTISGPGVPFRPATVESASNHCTLATGCSTTQWVPGQWDSSNDSTSNACCGVYDFTTHLDLTGLSSFSGTLVTLGWAADDTGEDILINGVDQLGSGPGYGNWGSLKRFDIVGSNPALKYGVINTITFPVLFSDIATNGITVQLVPVPEPETLLLLVGGLIALGAVRQFRRIIRRCKT